MKTPIKELVILHPGYERTIRNLQRKPQLDRVIALIRGDRSERAELIRRRISQLRAIDGEITELNGRIAFLHRMRDQWIHGSTRRAVDVDGDPCVAGTSIDLAPGG